MVCEMLEIMREEMKQQPKKSRDPKKIKQIESTMKGIGCKHSRHSNESK